MVITVDNYLAARSPSSTSNPQIIPLKAQAELETSTIYKGDLRNKAVALLVLHWLALVVRDPDGGPGASGSLKREKEDRLEREYLVDFSITKDHPNLAQTRWGMELLALRKACIIGPRNRYSPKV